MVVVSSPFVDPGQHQRIYLSSLKYIDIRICLASGHIHSTSSHSQSNPFSADSISLASILHKSSSHIKARPLQTLSMSKSEARGTEARFYHLGGGGRGRYHSRSTKRSSSRSHGGGAGLPGTSSIGRGLLGGSGGGRAFLSQLISFMRLRLAWRMSSLRPTRWAISSCQTH